MEENKKTNKGKENDNRRLKCLFNFICEILFETFLYTTVCRWQGYNICFVSVAGFMRETIFFYYCVIEKEINQRGVGFLGYIVIVFLLCSLHSCESNKRKCHELYVKILKHL